LVGLHALADFDSKSEPRTLADIRGSCDALEGVLCTHCNKKTTSASLLDWDKLTPAQRSKHQQQHNGVRPGRVPLFEVDPARFVIFFSFSFSSFFWQLLLLFVLAGAD
jgi:hypothetical protein